MNLVDINFKHKCKSYDLYLRIWVKPPVDKGMEKQKQKQKQKKNSSNSATAAPRTSMQYCELHLDATPICKCLHARPRA